MTKPDYEAIEAQLDAATPGPYLIDLTEINKMGCKVQIRPDRPNEMGIAYTWAPRRQIEKATNNAIFFAGAHGNITALLDRCRELEEALRTLSDAEAEYRQSHDLKGGAHIDTGRSWDQMRRAGDIARQALEGGN